MKLTLERFLELDEKKDGWGNEFLWNEKKKFCEKNFKREGNEEVIIIMRPRAPSFMSPNFGRSLFLKVLLYVDFMNRENKGEWDSK